MTRSTGYTPPRRVDDSLNLPPAQHQYRENNDALRPLTRHQSWLSFPTPRAAMPEPMICPQNQEYPSTWAQPNPEPPLSQPFSHADYYPQHELYDHVTPSVRGMPEQWSPERQHQGPAYSGLYYHPRPTSTRIWQADAPSTLHQAECERATPSPVFRPQPQPAHQQSIHSRQRPATTSRPRSRPIPQNIPRPRPEAQDFQREPVLSRAASPMPPHSAAQYQCSQLLPSTNVHVSPNVTQDARPDPSPCPTPIIPGSPLPPPYSSPLINSLADRTPQAPPPHGQAGTSHDSNTGLRESVSSPRDRVKNLRKNGQTLVQPRDDKPRSYETLCGGTRKALLVSHY